MLNRLHNEKLHYGYQVKGDEMGRHVERMGETRNACNILVGNPKGKE
jgi:hypothetical protein